MRKPFPILPRKRASSIPLKPFPISIPRNDSCNVIETSSNYNSLLLLFHDGIKLARLVLGIADVSFRPTG